MSQSPESIRRNPEPRPTGLAQWATGIGYLALLVFSLTMLASWITWSQPFVQSLPEWAVSIMTLGMILLMLLAWIAQMHADSRLEESLEQHGMLACTQCHYPLKSLPAEGRCPECGTSYSLAELPGIWVKWFDRRIPRLFTRAEPKKTQSPRDPE